MLKSVTDRPQHPELGRNTLQIAGMEVGYFEGGSGSPLVFLHGGGGLNPKAPFLRELTRHFRVVAPVHPGFYDSQLADWVTSVDDLAYVHMELMDRLGIEDALLVGASVGGWMAAEIATKSTARIARLVLVNPVGIKVGPRDRLDVPDIFLLTPDELNRLVSFNPEKTRVDWASLSEADQIALARNRETMALLTWEPYMHNPKLRHRLHRIDRPTLFVHGVADGLVSESYIRAYADLVPGAVLKTIPEAGHTPQVEQPELFVETILDFSRN